MKTEELDEIIREIQLLKKQKIFLHAKKSVIKDDSNENIVEQIADIDRLLSPLLETYIANTHRYIVHYKGEFSRIDNSTYWQEFEEELNLKTNCPIDTYANDWNNLPANYLDLLNEIVDFLYYTRFSKFEIINVKKI